MSVNKKYALTDADDAVVFDPNDVSATLGRLVAAPETFQATLPDIVKALVMDHAPSETGAKLRSSLNRSFSIRLKSDANVALTRILMQTLYVTPRNPCMVTFHQFILEPFTGPGQFDLVERDASDEPGGDSEVVIATISGLTDGITTGDWSNLAKVNTSDKIYTVVFTPGTTGAGVFSIGVRELDRFRAEEA